MRVPRKGVATTAAGATSAEKGSATTVEVGSSTRVMCRRRVRIGPSMGRLALPCLSLQGNSHRPPHLIRRRSNPKAEPPGQRQLARQGQDKLFLQHNRPWGQEWLTPSQETSRKSTASQQPCWVSNTQRWSGQRRPGRQPPRISCAATRPLSRNKSTPPRKKLAGCRRRSLELRTSYAPESRNWTKPSRPCNPLKSTSTKPGK